GADFAPVVDQAGGENEGDRAEKAEEVAFLRPKVLRRPFRDRRREKGRDGEGGEDGEAADRRRPAREASQRQAAGSAGEECEQGRGSTKGADESERQRRDVGVDVHGTTLIQGVREGER